MDPQSFIKYLSEYPALHELDGRTIQELIDRYPYCQNLHFLRCKKAQLEGDGDYAQYLSKAASYSTDRSFLFKKMQNDEPRSDAHSYESQELRYPSAAVLDDIPETALSHKESTEESVISKTLADLKVMKGTMADAESIDEIEEAEQLTTFSNLLFRNNDYMSDQDSLQESDERVAGRFQDQQSNSPTPKTKFKSYTSDLLGGAVAGLLSLNEAEMEENRRKLAAKLLREAEKRKEKEAEKKKNEELVQYAESSLIEKQDNATETLAGLLALQGHKDKAIAMYEKLKLQIPEKSAYFAAQIEKIKIS